MVTNGHKNGNGKPLPTLHYKKLSFLEHYERLCVIGKAAEAAGITRQTVYDWIRASEVFKTAYEGAKRGVVEKLEAEAIRRAYQGWEEPVFYKGQQQGLIRKYSDTLLIFLLKGAAPEKYRERLEHSGEGGGPVEVLVKVVYDSIDKGNNSPPA